MEFTHAVNGKLFLPRLDPRADLSLGREYTGVRARDEEPVAEADPRAQTATSMATASASITDSLQPVASASASTSVAGAIANAHAERRPSGSFHAQATASTPPTPTTLTPPISAADNLRTPVPPSPPRTANKDQELDLNSGTQDPPPYLPQPTPPATTKSCGPSSASTPSSDALTVHDHDFEIWPKEMQPLWKALSEVSLGAAYGQLLGLFAAFERASGFKHWEVRFSFSTCLCDLILFPDSRSTTFHPVPPYRGS